MDDIDPEVGLKFSKKSKRKKRIWDSFRWFYFFLFVEHVLALFFATMVFYLAYSVEDREIFVMSKVLK